MELYANQILGGLLLRLHVDVSIGRVAVCTSVLSFLWFGGAAAFSETQPAVHSPELLFDISDETLSLPLGVVTDVGVSDSVVYILDLQNFNIRRITLMGRELPSLGSQGEGPGDISDPCRIAVAPDGRCVVVQDLSSRAPCFAPDGNACEPYDTSALRKGRGWSVTWIRADWGREGELILSATVSERGSFAQFDPVGFVACVRDDGRGITLFSADGDNANGRAVAIPGGLLYPAYGWDTNREGTMIFADPEGAYRVHIGDPVGSSVTIDLPEWRNEDRRWPWAEKTRRKSPEKAPLRATCVYWLDNDHFMVGHAAESAATRAVNTVGTFEVFRRSGDSLGRYTVYCDLDLSNDVFFIRGTVLVVIRGAISVARAAYRAVPGSESLGGSSATAVDEVRIRAYELFSDVRHGR